MNSTARRQVLVGFLATALALAVAAVGAAGPAVADQSPTTPGLSPSTSAERRALPTVRPSAETRSRFDDAAGGDSDADDPAIWAHPSRPARSVVLGTLKNGGLDVYGLSGRLLQHVKAPAAPRDGLESSRFNNVDIAFDVEIRDRRRDIAVVSDRGRDRLRLYVINPAGSAAAGGKVLRDVTAERAPRLFNATEADVEEQETGYGLTVRRAERGSPWVVVSRRHTTQLGLFRLQATAGGRITYHRSARVRLPKSFELRSGRTWQPCGEPGEDPQVEGMVVDRRGDILYAAQEDVGVWRIPLRGNRFGGPPKLVEKVREFGVPATYDEDTEECTLNRPARKAPHLSADAEGLTIAYGRRGTALMLASSQGDSTFALFRLGERPHFVTGLRFVRGSQADGVDHSDGAAVLPSDLGRRYPRGLLVLHDGENTPVTTDDGGEPRADTDFKFVRWNRVLAAAR